MPRLPIPLPRLEPCASAALMSPWKSVFPQGHASVATSETVLCSSQLAPACPQPPTPPSSTAACLLLTQSRPFLRQPAPPHPRGGPGCLTPLATKHRCSQSENSTYLVRGGAIPAEKTLHLLEVSRSENKATGLGGLFGGRTESTGSGVPEGLRTSNSSEMSYALGKFQ